MYGTNFGLARLELKWLWILQRSLPEMAQRVSKTEPILSGPEPALSRGERRHVGAVRKRKFGAPDSSQETEDSHRSDQLRLVSHTSGEQNADFQSRQVFV